MTGTFVISLDFELFWGVRDKRILAHERANLLGGRRAVGEMLARFAVHRVRATWATVGLLFFTSRDEMLAGVPSTKPRYANAHLSPYPVLDAVGSTEQDDPCHFAGSLVRQIRDCPGQEIGTHTFSHYYALEAGQTADDFRDDLEAAARAASSFDISLTSLVFPRNQYNPTYLLVCHDFGLRAYRGNQRGWMYAARPDEHQRMWIRAVRLADAYLNLSGYQTYPITPDNGHLPVDVPASMFLRPWSRRLRLLEPLRLRRIKHAMTHAAQHGEIFHLWWHPENFGTNIAENLAILDKILAHFARLRDAHGMESRTMAETASLARPTEPRPMQHLRPS
ncbi:polysaccharide deacetylase family protein [Methylobacterium planeticum]|uniref:Polysaccharide deacetylase family protein n=1 Tax=Methylobacterium planeticum TaxID=2615211 RepID=A0A6N6MQM1_9HYPH|nr:polysaccharide deacetylase family protein [Methylobacterium planeticum]KAB1070773.1 polysaccharide deacetylase family protein [Methylobacterium planeticum]